jgi:hypothetical protein
VISVQQLMTIDGLPVHPLVVHAVVVLLPLSAVGVVLIALRPPWRRRYGAPVAVLAVLSVAAVPVAQQTGEQLKARLDATQNPLINQHAELGGTLLPYAIVFGVLAVALVLIGPVADRRRLVPESAAPESAAPEGGVPEQGPAGGRGPLRVLVVVIAALAVLSAVATTAQVIRIGHSGSEAVWEGIGTS